MKIKVGLFPLITIIFVVLKLVGFINWSWWCVFSPLWIPALLFGVISIFLYKVSK